MIESQSCRNGRITERTRGGVTLVEILIVVTILGILAGLVLANYEPGIADQLQGAAQVVVGDVAYARSLAVANNSQYRLTFDTATSRYWLEHSGTNAQLDVLPPSPFRSSSDAPTRQTTDLSALPSVSGSVELFALYRIGGALVQTATEIEFGPLGALTQPDKTVIWLACGGGDARRYMPIIVNPITGVADIGNLTAASPSLSDPESAESVPTGP